MPTYPPTVPSTRSAFILSYLRFHMLSTPWQEREMLRDLMGGACCGGARIEREGRSDAPLVCLVKSVRSA